MRVVLHGLKVIWQSKMFVWLQYLPQNMHCYTMHGNRNVPQNQICFILNWVYVLQKTVCRIICQVRFTSWPVTVVATNLLLQLCTAHTAWSESDQAVRTVHSCNSWWLALLWSDSGIKLVSVLFGKCTTLVVTKCWPIVIRQPRGDQ